MADPSIGGGRDVWASTAMLEATRLPIWMNVYLSKPGLTTSTQLHTDTQDVLLIQTTGRKRWRVYRPPPPGFTRTRTRTLRAP